MSVRLAHSVFGSAVGGSGKTPALILHGLFGSGNNWRALAGKLASETNRQVYTLDARNHGETQHTSEMTYDLMSHDTLKFIHDQDLDKVILIGHSMGGKTAMATALSHPAVIEGLVVVDVSPHRAPGGDGESIKLIRAMKNLDLSSLTNRREANAVLKNDIKDFSLRQFLLTNLVGNGDPFGQNHSLRWKMNLDAIEKSISTLKAFPKFETTYNRQTLFIGGGKSNYITAADEPRIKELFPLSTIRHIPRAGHWTHVDKPAEFLQLIRQYLSSLDNRTDSSQQRAI